MNLKLSLCFCIVFLFYFRMTHAEPDLLYVITCGSSTTKADGGSHVADTYKCTQSTDLSESCTPKRFEAADTLNRNQWFGAFPQAFFLSHVVFYIPTERNDITLLKLLDDTGTLCGIYNSSTPMPNQHEVTCNSATTSITLETGTATPFQFCEVKPFGYDNLINPAHILNTVAADIGCSGSSSCNFAKDTKTSMVTFFKASETASPYQAYVLTLDRWYNVSRVAVLIGRHQAQYHLRVYCEDADPCVSIDGDAGLKAIHPRVCNCVTTTISVRNTDSPLSILALDEVFVYGTAGSSKTAPIPIFYYGGSHSVSGSEPVKAADTHTTQCHVDSNNFITVDAAVGQELNLTLSDSYNITSIVLYGKVGSRENKGFIISNEYGNCGFYNMSVPMPPVLRFSSCNGLGKFFKIRTTSVTRLEICEMAIFGTFPGQLDGGWTDWSSWTSCSVTCGGGTSSRTRTCSNPYPVNGGTDCAGLGSESSSCTAAVPNCPVNGAWTAWSGWGSCSATCGSATQSRTRSCSAPAPQNSGDPCAGSDTDTKTCTLNGCPVNGQWALWSSWGSCSCNSSSQSRTRSCTNPAPQNSGSDCSGMSTESQSCSPASCPQDGNWTFWGSWTICSVTCGDGKKGRIRLCSNPEPLNGGAQCVGSSYQLSNCAAEMKCTDSNAGVKLLPIELILTTQLLLLISTVLSILL